MGDAILCTPALRAIRERFRSSRISFLANPVVRQILSPGTFNDQWIEQKEKNPVAISIRLKRHRFSHAILLKNSFASALAVFLSQVPIRIGYAREKRGFLLTDRLRAPKLPGGKFKPQSMIDYYLAIASWLGADTTDRRLELSAEPQAKERLLSKLPQLANPEGPMVVIVPGGAFGPSKCWPAKRYAQAADRLITSRNATVVISVAPAEAEKQIARRICNTSRHKLVNIGDNPLTLTELKALFSIADLAIANDTGPRHIAIALKRKVVSLFGPNDPAWTDSGSEKEIQIFGNVPCAPCSKPNCKEKQHLCMESITVDMVCNAAKGLLEDDRKHAKITTQRKLLEKSKSFFVDPEYESALSKAGLDSIDSVFSFDAAKNLDKSNLARFRSRAQFEIEPVDSSPSTTVFLKLYDRPPILIQLKNWLSARKRTSCGLLEYTSGRQLASFGINTPRTICCGEQWGGLFEERSFCITEKIPNAEALERKLPGYFTEQTDIGHLKLRRDFIARLADFVKRFHETDYRHRDLYFSHIFHSDDDEFYLIDLARAFKPLILRQRFQIKDIAQLHYSAPGRHFSKTDRLRFYMWYAHHNRLSRQDKVFVRSVLHKARRMARHDRKYGREVPFEN
jgi:heptosyltransferase-2